MFATIGSAAATITVFLDDRPIPARFGETIAACLLRAGTPYFRTTPVSGSPRLPFCMIGHCFDCLIEIEGIGSRQACISPVRPGMRIHTQHGAASIDSVAAQ
jgi:predicted molibdopterin-dependent oxidoreductase YjgC